MSTRNFWRTAALSLLLALSCAASAPLLARAASQEACALAPASDPAECPKLLDPLGQAIPRGDVPKGGFRTKLGLQFHPSCLEKAAEYGYDETEAKKHLEAWVERSYRKVVDECLTKYPPLRRYILGASKGDERFLGWLTQARRSVFTCAEKLGSGDQSYAAVHVSSPSKLTKYPAEVVKGIPLTVSGHDSLARAHETTIVLAHSSLRRMFTGEFLGGDAESDDTLIHELFHSTSANNLTDHNDREVIKWDPKAPCNQSIVDDRVNLIAGLCTGTKGSFAGDSAALALFNRMNHCGDKKGCEQVFTQQYGNLLDAPSLYDGLIERNHDKYSPSNGLEAAEATDLCKLIHDDGQCQHTLKTQEKTLAEGVPQLKAVAAKVAARVSAILPVGTNDVPAAMIEAYPELAAEAKELGYSPCFTSVFHNAYTPGNPLYIQAKEVTSNVDPEKRPHGFNYKGGERFAQARALAETAPACLSGDATKTAKVRHFIDELDRRVARAFSAHEFRAFAFKRYLGQTENYDSDWKSTHGDAVDHAAIEALFGKELLTEYLDTLERFSPQSAHFDCAAAGLSKHRAAKLAREAMAKALAQILAPNCPK